LPEISLSLANLITLGRLLLTPFVVYCLVTGSYLWAFIAFVVAGITDAVDGYIAKRWQQETELGAYLDPLADKALLVSIYVALGILAQRNPAAPPIPVWLVVAAVSRDLLIVGAMLLSWMLDRPMRVAPPLVSKANTASQIALAAVALAQLGLGLDVGLLRPALITLTAVLTFWSGAVYLVAWIRHMQQPRILAPPGRAGAERKNERVG
jgi:cardiolipin synthase